MSHENTPPSVPLPQQPESDPRRRSAHSGSEDEDDVPLHVLLKQQGQNAPMQMPPGAMMNMPMNMSMSSASSTGSGSSYTSRRSFPRSAGPMPGYFPPPSTYPPGMMMTSVPMPPNTMPMGMPMNMAPMNMQPMNMQPMSANGRRTSSPLAAGQVQAAAPVGQPVFTRPLPPPRPPPRSRMNARQRSSTSKSLPVQAMQNSSRKNQMRGKDGKVPPMPTNGKSKTFPSHNGRPSSADGAKKRRGVVIKNSSSSDDINNDLEKRESILEKFRNVFRRDSKNDETMKDMPTSSGSEEEEVSSNSGSDMDEMGMRRKLKDSAKDLSEKPTQQELTPVEFAKMLHNKQEPADEPPILAPLQLNFNTSAASIATPAPKSSDPAVAARDAKAIPEPIPPMPTLPASRSPFLAPNNDNKSVSGFFKKLFNRGGNNKRQSIMIVVPETAPQLDLNLDLPAIEVGRDLGIVESRTSSEVMANQVRETRELAIMHGVAWDENLDAFRQDLQNKPVPIPKASEASLVTKDLMDLYEDLCIRGVGFEELVSKFAY